MSIGQILGGVVVIGAFAALIGSNATQTERNIAAKAEIGQKSAIPAFSKQVNAQVAAEAAKPAAPAVPAKAAAAVMTLHAVDVTFPGSDRDFPPEPGADLVANNCTACHSAGMILTQPQLTKATWTAEVTKMQHTYKAPVADEDVAPIVAYLAALPIAK